jgi:hypothetical protein
MVYHLAPLKMDLLWLNPGVIGMPANDGNTAAHEKRDKHGQLSCHGDELVKTI